MDKHTLHVSYESYKEDEDKTNALYHWLNTEVKGLDIQDYPVPVEWLEKIKTPPDPTTEDAFYCPKLRDYYATYIYPMDVAENSMITFNGGFSQWLESKNYSYLKTKPFENQLKWLDSTSSSVGSFYANYINPVGLAINGLESTEPGRNLLNSIGFDEKKRKDFMDFYENFHSEFINHTLRMPYDMVVGAYEGVTTVVKYTAANPFEAMDKLWFMVKVSAQPPAYMEEKRLFYTMLGTFLCTAWKSFETASHAEKGKLAGAFASEVAMMFVGVGEVKAATKGLEFLKTGNYMEDILKVCMKSGKLDAKLFAKMLTSYGDESAMGIIKLLKNNPEEVFSKVKSIVKTGDSYILVDEAGKELPLCRSQILKELLNEGIPLKKAEKIVKNLEEGCFSGDTLIITKDGLKRIDEIQKEEYILSKDVNSGVCEYKKVVEVFVKSTIKWIRIDLGNEVIRSTEGHLFFTDTGWWQAARDVQAGTGVLGSDGEYRIVTAVGVEALEQPELTYNLHVEGFHTYYVGSNGLLVHNN